MENTKIIGLAGAARSGKDTFFSCFNKKLPTSKRYSFADELRKEVSPFIWKLYGIDVFNMSPQQKEEIRPLLVFHGQYMREKSDGYYWIDKVRDQIEGDSPDIAVVTDVRFPNEMEMVKKNGGSIVYIERLDENGKLVPPVNSDEAENCPIIRNSSDYVLKWESTENEEKLNDYIEDVIFNSNIFHSV